MVCHFGVKSGTRIIVQNEPQADYQAKIKLYLLFGSDVRLNDKIVDVDTGYEYTAELPINVREHHMFAMLQRTTVQKPIGPTEQIIEQGQDGQDGE